MGKVFKGLLKFTVAAATLGGVCYAFKDKIRETKVYQDHDMDNKIKKVTKTIKEKIPAVFDNEADYVDEDELNNYIKQYNYSQIKEFANLTIGKIK